MAEASVPLNLFNPGQVFACLGFLEAADVLLEGGAEGGFDWSDEANVRFRLRARGNANPFAVVLSFLAEAKVYRCEPVGYANPVVGKKSKGATERKDEDSAAVIDLRHLEGFPGPDVDQMALPIRLESGYFSPIDLGHWADGSSRNGFKLYAGNRSAASIAFAMLHGSREKSSKGPGVATTHGVAALWNRERDHLTANPFGVLTAMGGSFNFDARGGWTALDAGYSPNKHTNHWITESPVVEILAPWGLEHARPDEYEKRLVRYGAWNGIVPPILARPALAGDSVTLVVRRFRFVLDMSGKNKVVTFAQEERPA